MLALETTNQELWDLSHGEAAHEWAPVSAFVTFESDDSYDAAQQLDSITVGGLPCTIKQAPEPETLKWDHLEYSRWETTYQKTSRALHG